MSDKTSLVLGIIYVVVAIILIVLVLVMYDKHNKKKYNGILRDLERNKNLIISGSILTEFNKLLVVFPSSVVAGMKNLTKQDFFEVEEEKKQDVKINL